MWECLTNKIVHKEVRNKITHLGIIFKELHIKKFNAKVMLQSLPVIIKEFKMKKQELL
jgi:hypothetical protein